MSPRQAADGGGSGARVGITALLLVVAAAGMLLLVRARPDPEAFDPRSGGGSGTRALVLLLERQGAAVDVVRSAPEPGSDARVLVLEDRLNDDQRADLLEFVLDGGVVVMADPDSTFAFDDVTTAPIIGSLPPGGTNDIDAQVNVPLGACQVRALEHLRGVFVLSGLRFELPTDGNSGCFADESGAFVAAHQRGEGVIVQLGDNEMFTNSLLRYADNGPLATALLAPTDSSRVSILMGEDAAKSVADIGTGERTLSDLVRPGVWMALTQLAIAFVVFAVARAIRPGRPVREPDQVPIAGSELVVATGNLMQRAHHAQRAGWLLRGNAYRELCRRMHLPATTSIAALDAAMADRTSLPPGHVAAVLEREVHDNAGLVHLSATLQDIRDATLGPVKEPTSER